MTRILSCDFETYLIDMQRPWISPKPVSFAICSGDESILKLAGNYGQDIENLLEEAFDLVLKEGYRMVWQNGIGFDLPLIWAHYPDFRPRLLSALERGLISDTMVRERLYDLSTTGEIRMKKGSYSLETMVKKYIGLDISSSKSGDDIWRLRHCELDGMKAADYPKEAIEYDLKDVVWLKDVWLAQERNRADRGYGSMNTEALQVKSYFVLHLAYQKGLKVNYERLNDLEATLDVRMAPIQQYLIDRGMAHIDKKGRFVKRQKEFISYLTSRYADYVKRTSPSKTHPDGQVATDDAALADFPPDDIIQARQSLSGLDKYKHTYLKNIKRDGMRFHEKYDYLKETGRTGSFMQTMPREGGIRELFEPDEGHKFVVLDYAHIEADSMAQCYKDLGLGSGLADYLNTGEDYHALIGSAWYNSQNNSKLSPSEFSERRKSGDLDCKQYRQLGKPAGLGLSGGIGPDTLRSTARGQGIELSEEDAISSLRFAEEKVPGLAAFRGVWRSGDKGWLGKQKLISKKRIGTRKTKDGRTVPLQQDQYGYEVNGRYRAGCTYCALANGLSMQSPAADGAKEAIWSTFKHIKEKEIEYGEEIGDLVFFVHDEIGYQIKEEWASLMKMDIAERMCSGMQLILPDVRVTVEGGITSIWTKEESKWDSHYKAYRTPEGTMGVA